jgi:hypothetical protein
MMQRMRWIRLAAPLAVCGLLGAALPAGAYLEFEPNPFAGPRLVPTGGGAFVGNAPHEVIVINAELDAGDTDFHAFELEAGDLLLAALFEDENGERHDTSLGVYFGAGATPVATNDDGGQGRLSRIAVPIDTTGTWKVGVTGFGDTAFDGSHAEAAAGPIAYQLVVAVTRQTPLREESDATTPNSNDSLETADLLPAGGTTLRARLDPNDDDFFAIELEVGDRITASVFDLAAMGFDSDRGERNDPVLALHDPTGLTANRINDDGGPGFLPNLGFVADQSGTWTLGVFPLGGKGYPALPPADAFDYELVVATTAACPNPVQVISSITPPPVPPGDPPAGEYVAANLGEGDHYYTDRLSPTSHLLIDVPAELECADWIRTRNDDKEVAIEDFLQFTIDETALVHVGYDNRATEHPAWLTSAFVPLPLTLDIQEDGSQTGFNVWRGIFPAGTVSLGGNRASPVTGTSAGSNYVVLVTLPESSGALRLYGVAEGGGTVDLDFGGESTGVATSAGQTADQVAAALAAAINADGNLAALGIVALADGDRVVTSGDITGFTSTDPGISDSPIVPAVSGPATLVLALALLAAGALLARRRVAR